MNGREAVCRLDLNQKVILDKQVGPKRFVENDPAIFDRNGLLAFDHKPAIDEASGKACFINRFQQSRAQRVMQLEPAIDSNGCQPFQSFAQQSSLASYSLWLRRFV